MVGGKVVWIVRSLKRRTYSKWSNASEDPEVVLLAIIVALIIVWMVFPLFGTWEGISITFSYFKK